MVSLDPRKCENGYFLRKYRAWALIKSEDFAKCVFFFFFLVLDDAGTTVTLTGTVYAHGSAEVAEYRNQTLPDDIEIFTSVSIDSSAELLVVT